MINVLITGAGFTANFGAPLASDIYEKIFNSKEIQGNDILNGIIKNKMNIRTANYEKIYQDVIYNASYPSEEKKILRNILFKVLMDDIDKYCRTPNFNKKSSNGKSILEHLHLFLIKLSNTNDKSIFFTLNQDMFIERQCNQLSSDYLSESSDHVRRKLRERGHDTENPICFKRLGVNHYKIGKNSKYDTRNDIEINSFTVREAKNEFKKWREGKSLHCLYVKLHGSQDFVDEQGNRVLITGTHKTSQISSSGLIEYYNEIFDNTLSYESCRIIIIGYSFNDEHINKSIIKALKNKDTIFYLVDYKSLKDFLEDLNSKPGFKGKSMSAITNVNQLITKLCGYLSHGLDPEDLENIMFNTFLPDFTAKR